VAGLDELLGRLESDDYRRGRQFERIVKWFLDHAAEYETLLRTVWLWDDWPDRPSRDLGIDLVAEDREGGVWAIQAKAYVPDYSVTKRDVDSFLSASASKRFSYRLLVATTDRVAANALKTIAEQAIPVGMLLRSDLRAAELSWPSSPSRLVAAKPPRKKLRPHQRRALSDVVQGFTTSSRGQMVMACGTGKTLAALGVHESFDSKRTLVLVPSLSLLSQTLREWTANAKEPFEYLAVCSDETVADPDAPVSTTHDLGIPVTTDANDIAVFLSHRARRVVFSTYQSSPQIAASYRRKQKPPPLDLAICDEAHRCAGPVSSDFATILDAKKIRAKRRLFMTATPRYFTGRIIREAEEADLEIASMDDEAVFGPVFHRLSFGEAIEQDLLSDYRVVIIGVDDATYKAWAEHGRLVTRDGTKVTDARMLAGQIGLAKAMRKFDLRRVITFHGRIATARRFSNELPEVIAWMPSRHRPTGRIQADYVSGEMSTGERRRRLSRLANPHARERALLSNARCLAEGVDVPTLDGVAFIDPRRSEIDIIQSVGRAIRLAPYKELGTIVLPVFIDSEGDTDEVLDQSVFKPIWDVLKALRSHDEELADELDALRVTRGRAGTSGRLPGKIVIDLPTTVGVEFAEQFNARLVDATTAPWEYSFGVLEAFVAREGHSRVPRDHVEHDVHLGRWTNSQRILHRNGLLLSPRVARLEALPGWSWEPRRDRWEDRFDLLKAFVAREGHAQVPDGYIDEGDVELGSWVVTQRGFYRRGRLSARRVARLEAVAGWSWDPFPDRWERNFALLERFVAREGHARVPPDHVEDDVQLGTWMGNLRSVFYKQGRLSDRQIARLEALPGWSWEPHRDQWEDRFDLLEAFVAREGHAHVPRDHVEDKVRLGNWVVVQRRAYKQGRLSDRQIARVEALPGWSWDQRVDQWEGTFAVLEHFVAREGHARVPKRHVEGDVRLGSWVATQQRLYRAERLTASRAARLEALPGWVWARHPQQWENYFALLERFVAREGHARVLNSHVEGRKKLGIWVSTQRHAYKQGRLSEGRIARLEAVPGWSWDARQRPKR
jgi:superfamily II DNA or RNA helicase